MQGLISHIKSTIQTEKPSVKWKDVVGLEQTKVALQEAVIDPIKHPHLFASICESEVPGKGILLYGPPGVGKTYLAKVCAAEANATFFFVTCLDILSKYIGESEKFVQGLFELARASKPAIIFIDAIDCLFPQKIENESEAVKRVKSEFLKQMQSIEKESTVRVLGETNLPWHLDSDIRRIFGKRIYFPLPDFLVRKSLFVKELNAIQNTLTQEDVEYLATKTEGQGRICARDIYIFNRYSGSDILVVSREAVYEPLREVQKATHFQKVGTLEDGKSVYQACESADPNAEAMSLFDLEGPQLKLRSLEMRDFKIALEKTKPSVCADDLKKHEKFSEEFGAN